MKDYRIEIATLLAVLFGLFLWADPFPIRPFLASFWSLSKESFSFYLTWLGATLDQLTLSEYFGGVLVLIATGVILRRAHYRILRSLQDAAYQCPHCGSPLSRIHRTSVDRFLGTLLHLRLRRFSCRHCGWAGLRIT